MKYNSVFTPADILLPKYGTTDKMWQSYSVIACDQFTSEPDYWRSAENIAATAEISTLGLVLPEAYLGKPEEKNRNAQIAENMKSVRSQLTSYPDSLVYLERTLPDGKVRHGIVGKIDLEAYDYSEGSTSAVRATEATVIERIPPRVAIRAAATVELPHIMIFVDDKKPLILTLSDKTEKMEPLYDFDLMQGGGHVKGYRICGRLLEEVMADITAYEASMQGKMAYAMGDGNHSLASAKAHYENIKKSLGDAAANHPARYALAEIVSLGDSAIEFEPIYRIMNGCDTTDVIDSFKTFASDGMAVGEVEVITAGTSEKVKISGKTHPLTVGALQNFIDEYVKSHPGVTCDYIHGESSVRHLATKSGSVAFVFDGMAKDELFPYVEKNGALPRKTFSMGEAKSKRYYLEARAIVE